MTTRQFKLDRKVSSAQQLVGAWGPGPSGGAILHDMSPLGRGDGAINAGVAWTVDPVRGDVLFFDGVATNEVVLGNLPYFQAIPRFSITLWVMITNVGQDSALITKGTGGAFSPFFLWFDFAAPVHWGLIVYDGVDAGAATSAFVPLVNTWYHLAVTFEPAVARIYTDGVEDANSPFAMPLVDEVRDVVTDWAIGNNTLQTMRATGYIQDVRFYDRVLSLAQIEHIHRSTRFHPYADLLHRTTRRLVHRHRAEVR